MKIERLDTLILSYEDGTLTPEEEEELIQRLSESPEARLRLVESGVLRETAASHLAPLAEVAGEGGAGRMRARTWFQRKPLAAAAAGVLIGLFGSTFVAGDGGGIQRWQLPLGNPSFERAETLPQVNLVPVAGQWSGLDTEIVAGGGSRPGARSGERILRLGPAPAGKGYFASVMADLAESRPGSFGRTKKIEVTARFHASEDGQGEHYLLAVSTFAEEPSRVPDLWESNWRSMTSRALSSSHRAIFPTAEETGWQTIVVEVEVPLEARTLVVTLGSNTPGPVAERTDHFMDDVEASWILLDESPTDPSP